MKDRTNAGLMGTGRTSCSWSEVPGMQERYSSHCPLTTTWSSGYSTTVLNIRFSLRLFFKSSSRYLWREFSIMTSDHNLINSSSQITTGLWTGGMLINCLEQQLWQYFSSLLAGKMLVEKYVYSCFSKSQNRNLSKFNKYKLGNLLWEAE